jgi:hypothetical protein
MLRALTLVVAITLSLGAASAQRVSQPETSAAAAQAADKNSAPNQATPPPAQTEPQRTPDYQWDCAHPKDREQADLCAQWLAARSANGTLWWMRLEVFLLAGALGASALATFASIDAARTARKALEGLERPYLYVRVLGFGVQRIQRSDHPTEEIVTALKLTLTNHGRAPCVLREIGVQFKQAGKMDAVVASAGYEERPNAVINAGDEFPKDRGIRRDFDEDVWTKYRQRTEFTYITGAARYEDFFGNEYLRVFAFSTEGGKNPSEYGGRKYNYDRRLKEPSWFARLKRRVHRFLKPYPRTIVRNEAEQSADNPKQ